MFAQIGRVFFFIKYFSGDVVFLITIFVILFAFGLYFGKGSLVSLILSFYPANLLFNTFPFISKTLIFHDDKLLLLNKIVIFFIFLIPIAIIVDRYISPKSSSRGIPDTFKIAGLALALTILVVIFSYSTVNYDLLQNFSPKIDLLFSTPARLFYWNLVPIILLAMF